MCVLAFAWRAHPRWPLVFAGNRDELHDRPAAPLAPWEKPGHVIPGRDLQSGGTWLGVSEQRRFAVVTNLRGHDGAEPERTSRGALVAGVLSGDLLEELGKAELAGFNPFNLILVDQDQAWFLSNQPEPVRSRLAPGIYGLSNGMLDEPWPKTLQLKARLLDWVVNEAEHPETLLGALRDETLPDVGIASALPSDAPLEPRASPIFIRHPVYGTRCSTVVAIDDRGTGIIVERRYDQAGHFDGQSRVPFVWSA